MKCDTRALLLCALVPVAFARCNAPGNGPLPLTSPTLERAVVLLQIEANAPHAAERRHAIEALQVLADPRAADVIEQGLHDADWQVRFSAAMAAGSLKGAYASNVRPTLNTMVTHDASGSVRAACIFALRQMGDTTHMSDLAAMLDAPDLQTEADTAFVLGMMHDPSAIPLLQMHRDKPLAVRDEITAALARLGDDLSQQVVVGWAISKYADDQWKAMQICADLPPSMGRSPLLLGLDDVPAKLPPGESDTDKTTIQNLTTRRQLVAARSLAKMHDDSGVKVAVQNLANSDDSLRMLAVLAVGDMLDSRDAPKLEPLLADRSDDVKLAAAAAVVAIYARAQAGQ